VVDGFLARGGDEANRVWDILTALRSGDEVVDRQFKYCMTVPIRRAALPLTAKANDEKRIDTADFDALSFQTPNPNYYNHYQIHVAAAAQALNAIGRKVV
jgi:hypothetical protein